MHGSTFIIRSFLETGGRWHFPLENLERFPADRFMGEEAPRIFLAANRLEEFL